MLGAELLGLSRRMQGIRQQEQAGSQFRSFFRGFLCSLGAEHAGLPPAVGVASEKYVAAREILDDRGCVLQACAVAFAVARSRRAVGAILTVGEIAAQHDEAGLGKSFRQRDQQRRLTVRSRTVGQNKAVAIGRGRAVQKAAHERVHGNVGKNLRAGFGMMASF